MFFAECTPPTKLKPANADSGSRRPRGLAYLVSMSALAWMLFLSSDVRADPIADCYAKAEATHPDLAVKVFAQGAPVANSSELSAVMNAVAQYHAEPSLELAHNAPGGAAIRDALRCIFDGGNATLSSIVINERFHQLKVRPVTIRWLTEDGAASGTMNFTEVERTCEGGPADRPSCDGHYLLRFAGHGRSTVLPVSMVANAYDFGGSLTSVVSVCTPGAFTPCSGTCLGECTEEKPFADCYCDGGTGGCVAGLASSEPGGSGEIAVVVMN